jgi:hypothetical protein
MVIHELATNAAKYGALSVPEGRLEVVWKTTTPRLSLVWEERDGPEVVVPNQTGFGSTLIERLLVRQCGASYRTDFRRSGLCFQLDLPLDVELTPAGDTRDRTERGPRRRLTLRTRRSLGFSCPEPTNLMSVYDTAQLVR